MKSKKLLCALATVALSATFSAGLAACGHEHTFSEDWTPDGANGHYHEATCNDYDGEKNSFEAHADTDNDGKCDKCDYDMTPATVAVTGITISGADTVKVGESITLTATLAPTGATGTVVWSSLDTSKATVNASTGVVTGVAAGTVSIKATVGTVTQTKEITVTAAQKAPAVSAAEWEAAFTFDGVEFDLNEVDESGDGKERYVYKYRQNNFGVYSYVGDATEPIGIRLGSKEDAKFFNYEMTDGEWTKAEITESDYTDDGIFDIPVGFKQIFTFDKFTYDADKEEYFAATAGEYKNVKIILSEGKVISIDVSVDPDITIKFTFDYQVAPIDIPADVKENEVTAEEWAAAMRISGTNSTAVYQMSQGSNTATMTYFYDGDKIKQQGENGYNNYAEYSGGKYYKYTEHQGSATKEASSKSEFDNYKIDTALLLYLPFDKFTFDSSSGKYVAAQYYIDGDDSHPVTNAAVEIKDGKLVSATFTGDGRTHDITVTYGGASVTLPQAELLMTAELWEEAFEVGTTYGYTQHAVENGSEVETNVEISLNNAHYVLERDGITFEGYISKQNNGDIYLYTKNYEYWNRTVSDEMADFITQNALLMKLFFPFDKFEKGDKPDTYVSKTDYEVVVDDSDVNNPVSVGISDAVVKFENGKVKSLEYMIGSDEYSVTFKSVTTVVIPEMTSSDVIDSVDAWNAALAAVGGANYRVGFGEQGVFIAEYKQAENVKYMRVNASLMGGKGVLEIYYVFENGVCYSYENKYGEWIKQQVAGITEEAFNQLDYKTLLNIEIDFTELSMSDFEYDGFEGAYVSTKAIDGIGKRVSVKFKDGKLVSLMGDGQGLDFVYGDAELVTPVISAGEQVSDEEWATAFDLDFENGEANIEAANPNGGTMYFSFKKDGGVIYQNMGGEVYVVADNGSYYILEPKGGVWTKSELTKDEYDTYLPKNSLGDFADKTGYTWDEASGTYKTSGMGETEIKFVDKKLKYIIATGQSIYFSYGATEITLPEEGSPAQSGGGTDPDIRPEPQVTEDEWREKLSNAFDSAPNFYAYITVDGVRNEYDFAIDEGYIVCKTLDDNGQIVEQKVYAEEGGKVYLYSQADNQDGYTKTATEFATLAEVKEYLLGDIFVPEILGGEKIADCYGSFECYGGHAFNYASGNTNINVQFWDNGSIMIDFATEDGPTEACEIRDFGDVFAAFPDWYPHKGTQVTQEEWEKAVAMQYDNYYYYSRHFSDSSKTVEVHKHGYDLYVRETVGNVETEFYLTKENDKYFRYSVNEQNIWEKTAIYQGEYSIYYAETDLRVLLPYESFTFDGNNDTYSSEQTRESGEAVLGNFRVTFLGKRLSHVSYSVTVGDDTQTEEYSYYYGGFDFELPEEGSEATNKDDGQNGKA